jgi:hypothetical protein
MCGKCYPNSVPSFDETWPKELKGYSSPAKTNSFNRKLMLLIFKAATLLE